MTEYRVDIIKQGLQRVGWLHLSGGGLADNENEFDEGISLPPYC